MAQEFSKAVHFYSRVVYDNHGEKRYDQNESDPWGYGKKPTICSSQYRRFTTNDTNEVTCKKCLTVLRALDAKSVLDIGNAGH